MWVWLAIRKAKGTIWYNSKKNNVSHVVWCGLAETSVPLFASQAT